MGGKVVDYRVPIDIERVIACSGDLIVADDEGVMVVPQAVETEAIAAALEKVDTENKVALAIRDGMSAREAFDTFGVM